MKISILPAASTDNASARLRAFNLCSALAASGQEAAIEVMRDADVLFIHKKFDDSILQYARLIKDRGGVVIYDLDESSPDALAQINDRPEQWQDLVSVADVITTDSQTRQSLLQQAIPNAVVQVLPNGIDFCPDVPPGIRAADSERLQIVWFGRIEDLYQIAPYMDTLHSLDADLHVATDADAVSEVGSLLPGVNVVPWSPDTFPALLRSCNLALLIHQGDAHDQAASNQKMLACIANGVVPLVTANEEYAALAQEIKATDSIFSTPEELAHAVSSYASLDARAAYLDKAQALVVGRYGPAATVKAFMEIVAAACTRGNEAHAPVTDASPQGGQAHAPLAVTSSPASPASPEDDSSGKPLVSVIIPTKDRPQLLGQALQSLQYQTYKHFEVVLVNDGGCEVENLVDFFSRHFDIAYSRHPRPRGASAARNTGLRLAKGEIVTYLDDDDYYLADHLETIVEALQDPSVDFVYTDAEYVHFKLENGRPKENLRNQPYRQKAYSREELLIANYIPTPTWGHRAALLEKTGLFDESLRILEDWDFLIRASAAGTFRKVEKVTIEVRQAQYRDDHTLPIAVRQLPVFRQIYARYPDVSDGIAQYRLRFLKELEEPSGPQAVEAPSKAQMAYEAWMSKHTLEPVHAHIYAEHMLRWPSRPRFVIIVPTRQKDLAQIAKTIDSLQLQLYGEWQLIVVADFDAPGKVFENSDILGWLRIDDLGNDELFVQACNGILEAVPSDWVALLPPGSTIEGHAFLALGDYALLHPEWQAIYTDHDCIAEEGRRFKPAFKPDFNLDYFRSMDYVGAAVWFRTVALKELGGIGAFPGAWQYDALWRIHDRCGAAAIGHLAEPLLHLPAWHGEHQLADAARQVALESHLARQGLQASVMAGLVPGTFRVDYPLAATPLVSIIIPNRDCAWYLQPCIDGLFEKTEYPNFEVIVVDNQSTDPDTLAYYREIEKRHGDRVRIVSYDHPFNFSDQCNLGVQESRGEYLVLLNNDTEIVQPSWLTRMLQIGQRQDVGIVGARLVYPETGTIQHAGVIVGLGLLASHPYQNHTIDEPGYMNRLQVDQNYSAVTAACMLVRRSVYLEVGGMNAEHLKVLFNDVDLCLKVREAGYRIVWTPYATLVHLEHKSLEIESKRYEAHPQIQARDQQAAEYMHTRWRKTLANDPAYNRHLGLSIGDFSVDPNLVADWDANFQDRHRILAFPPAGGVGEYRFYAPLRGLAMEARIQSTVVQTTKYHHTRYPSLPELNRLDPHTLMRQVSFDPMDLEWLMFYRHHRPDLLYLYMMDDLITVMPRENPNFRIVPRDSRARLRQLLAHADRLIVSTEPLLDMAREMIGDVRLLPNRLRDDLWLPLQSRRNTSPRPRVGWAGAQQHAGDLALIVDAVKQTAHEVDWIFFGMCPEELRPYIREFHDFEVGVEAYPAKLASLNLDLAVAPLEVHPFNEAKSNLRILEYGILGLPVICTDILPYRTDAAPVKLVANDTKQWVEAIRERAHDVQAAYREGDALKEWVLKNYMLSRHLDPWYQALTEPRR